ncbi:MAG: c-type cytochrome biogenesis protein CcsB [Bacillota bacterium]
MESLQIPVMIITLIVLILSFLLYMVSFLNNRQSLKQTARFTVVAAFILNTILLMKRTVLAGTLPLSNLFEFGLFFVWAVLLVFLVIEYKYEMAGSGIFVLPVAIILLFWLFSHDHAIRPMMPALRSPWLFVHVLTAVIAYGAFAVSFTMAVMYLLKDYLLGANYKSILIKVLPSLDLLDELTYKITFIGLPFHTIMLVTGAVWAEFSWGRYWSWDPKETWALITWLIYAVYLHVRLMRGWKGKRAAILAILGFLAVIFTFIGVSYLLPGQHSYV